MVQVFLQPPGLLRLAYASVGFGHAHRSVEGHTLKDGHYDEYITDMYIYIYMYIYIRGVYKGS